MGKKNKGPVRKTPASQAMAVPGTSGTSGTSRTEEQDNQWKHFGIVDSLYIYPLDGGRGIRCKSLQCFRTGCCEVGESKSENNTFLLKERCFVVYKFNRRTTEKVALLDHPNLASISITRTNHKVTLSSPYTRMTAQLNMILVKKTALVNVYYLNDQHIIRVHDCGAATSFLNEVSPIRNREVILCLGYYEPDFNYLDNQFSILNELKDAQNKAQYDELYIKTLSPRYSSCTFINEKSVEKIKSLIDNPTITSRHFRPNVIIKNNKKEFSEDNIESLKIRKVEFGYKIFCTHDLCCCADPETGVLSEDREPHIILLQKRKLESVNPAISDPELTPVFGINMRVLNDGQIITEGDAIQVKYSRDHF